MGKKLFVLAAALVLTLPLLLMPFGVDIRAYRTDAQVATFAEDPAGYVTDRLALRTAAITGRSLLLGFIGESGSPQVIRGREGFLFFAESLNAQPLRNMILRNAAGGLSPAQRHVFVGEQQPAARVRGQRFAGQQGKGFFLCNLARAGRLRGPERHGQRVVGLDVVPAHAAQVKAVADDSDALEIGRAGGNQPEIFARADNLAPVQNRLQPRRDVQKHADRRLNFLVGLGRFCLERRGISLALFLHERQEMSFAAQLVRP